jgi:hypothetical protein
MGQFAIQFGERLEGRTLCRQSRQQRYATLWRGIDEPLRQATEELLADALWPGHSDAPYAQSIGGLLTRVFQLRPSRRAPLQVLHLGRLVAVGQVEARPSKQARHVPAAHGPVMQRNFKRAWASLEPCSHPRGAETLYVRCLRWKQSYLHFEKLIRLVLLPPRRQEVSSNSSASRKQSSMLSRGLLRLQPHDACALEVMRPNFWVEQLAQLVLLSDYAGQLPESFAALIRDLAFRRTAAGHRT